MGRKKRGTFLLGGALTGTANGLFGGGGGMIVVPFLQRAAGYSALKAHATAIAVIAPASVFSGAVYALCGFTPLFVLLPVSLGVAAGGFLGAKLLARAPAPFVSLLFSLLMLAAGLRMLF